MKAVSQWWPSPGKQLQDMMTTLSLKNQFRGFFFFFNLSGKLKNLWDKNVFLSPLRGHKTTFLVFVILVTKAEKTTEI